MAEVLTEEKEVLAQAVKSFAANRDEASFEKLYKLTYKKLFAYIQMMTKDKEKTDDVLQNGYLICYRKIDQVNPDKFMGWMRKICYRELLNSCDDRETLLADTQSVDEDVDFFDTIKDDKMEMPEKAAEDANLKKLLLKNINMLPEKQRMALVAFYFEDRSIKDIAESMGAPENTVKTYLNRARKSMNDSMKSYADANGLKLVPFTVIPFMAMLFGEDASACELLAGTGSALWNKIRQMILKGAVNGTAAASEATGTAGTGTAGTAGAGMGSIAGTAGAVSGTAGIGLGLKIAIGGLIAVLIGGGAGAFATYRYIEHKRQEQALEEMEVAEDQFADAGEGLDADADDNQAAPEQEEKEPQNKEPESEESNEKEVVSLSEEELKQKLADAAGVSLDEIGEFAYNDYDKDGVYEAFSVVDYRLTDTGLLDAVWFVSPTRADLINEGKMEVCWLEKEESNNEFVYLDSGKRIWLLIGSSAGTGIEWDDIYSVKDGQYYKSKVEGMTVNMVYEKYEDGLLTMDQYPEYISAESNFKTVTYRYDPDIDDFVQEGEVADGNGGSADTENADYCKDIHDKYGWETGFYIDLNSVQELDDCYQMEVNVTFEYEGEPSAPMDVIRIEKDAPAIIFDYETIKTGWWDGGVDTTFGEIVRDYPGRKVWMCDVEYREDGYINWIQSITVTG